jgi:hypothetical protein
MDNPVENLKSLVSKRDEIEQELDLINLKLEPLISAGIFSIFKFKI